MNVFFHAVILIAALCFVPVGHASGDSHEGIEITVNINTANAEELDKLLLGIGPDKATNIIEYRNTHGTFTTADELENVKGIGAATVAKNRERIKL